MSEGPEAREIYRAVGRAIARARAMADPPITQGELAEITEGVVSRSSLANIESGRQRISVFQLCVIARALRRPPDEFLPQPPEPQIDPDARAWAVDLEILDEEETPDATRTESHRGPRSQDPGGAGSHEARSRRGASRS